MLGTARRKFAAFAACAAVAAGIGVGGSLAIAGSTSGQPLTPNSPSLIANGHGIDAVAVSESGNNSTVGSTTTQTLLPGMQVRITVPTGHTAILIARFSAESACYGGDTAQPDWCIATIKVGNVEMRPQTGGDFAFDSTDNGSESAASWESHAMERWLQVGAGTYTVHVYGSTTKFGTAQPTFWTGERELTVESSLTS